MEQRIRSATRGLPDFGPFPSRPTVPAITDSTGGVHCAWTTPNFLSEVPAGADGWADNGDLLTLDPGGVGEEIGTFPGGQTAVVAKDTLGTEFALYISHDADSQAQPAATEFWENAITP